jgi:phosphoglycerol geranylgeranyltransferase
MAENWKKWKHITKLDPDKKINDKIIESIIETGTDAIMISGTQNITKSNVAELLKMLNEHDIPKVLEPASPRGLVYKNVDWFFVPSVFNTHYDLYINGMHKIWVKMHKDKINWDVVVPEAYIILNQKCAAAKVSKAFDMTLEGTVATAVCAEKFFNFPVIYIEYSGTYGNPEIVKAVSEALTKAQLFYGGGINTKERAEEMSQWATIVVGNTIYENGTYSFIDTVRGRLLREMSDIQSRLGKLKKLRKKSKNELPEEPKKTIKPRIRIPSFKHKKSPVDKGKKAEKESS